MQEDLYEMILLHQQVFVSKPKNKLNKTNIGLSCIHVRYQNEHYEDKTQFAIY